MKSLTYIAAAAALSLLTGCATLTEDENTLIALSFSDGSSGTCDLANKRRSYTEKIPAAIEIRKSDDSLRYNCKTDDGRKAKGDIPSTMGGKIVASAIFLDFGIVDSITDKHRRYPASFVIPIVKP